MSSFQNKTVLIVSHDAGGAEIISSWVSRRKDAKFRFLLEGPAIKVFSRKFPGIEILNREQAFAGLSEVDAILAGTGWASDLERTAIQTAREKKIHSIAFLDHWVDYPARFRFNGREMLPDEIWTGDEFACDLAGKTFPNAVVKLEGNPYFSEMVEAITRARGKNERAEDGVCVLYLCEPRIEVSIKKYGHPNYWGYDEFQALDGYLKYLAEEKVKIEKVVLRLHPSENPGKYSRIVEKFHDLLPVAEGGFPGLVEDCAWADWVVGCDSLAMAIAVKAGKKVFSCIPKGGKELTIPFPEIIRLFSI